MEAAFEVQRSGLSGLNWTVVCHGPEDKAREVFRRQLRLYSVGRFRLMSPDGRVIEEGTATPLFSKN
jgi:hypothetical protein